MAPRFEPPDETKSVAMSRQRTRDTAIELAVRRELHRRGLRYRLQRRIVPGAPRRAVDIVFPGPMVAVDCRACWWHGCPDHVSLPTRNRAWWAEKLRTNRARDRDTEKRLAAAGWAMAVVWEHDDVATAAASIERLVRDRTRRRP